MHDLDRSMFEAEGLDGEQDEAEQLEEQEFLALLRQFTQRGGGGPGGPDQGAFEGLRPRGELDDRSAREVALASELLEVQTSAELDRFLGALLRRVSGAGRRFVRSATGRALGGVLKQAAAQALPMVADAVGGQATPGTAGPDGPGLGGLGRAGGPTAVELGLELEGLSQEDREFEVARAFVRFADAAARIAAHAPQGRPPAANAGASATAAARRHLPGLLVQGAARGREHSGRWLRQGNEFVVDGA